VHFSEYKTDGAYFIIHQPALLPSASFRHILMHHPFLWLPFAPVRRGMDFDQDFCHNPGHYRLAAGTYPAHNNRFHGPCFAGSMKRAVGGIGKESALQKDL